MLSSFTNNPIIAYISRGDIPGLLIYLLSLLLAMCIAVSFHECAHAFVADKLGDPTAKNMGRLSLDPLKHMNWIGLLCFVFFRIGFANPVIVNPRNLKHYRRDDVLISLAGVVTNLLLSFIFYGILFFIAAKVKEPNEILVSVLSMIISLNLSFALFNILPIPPLDGFHVVSSIFIRKSYKVVQFLQRYGFILLLILIITGVIPWLLSTAANWFITLFFKFFSLFI